MARYSRKSQSGRNERHLCLRSLVCPYLSRRVTLLTNLSSRGLTNPAPGVFDFDDYRALDPLFRMAMEIGIWIVLRPGPYINAETTG